MNESLGPITGPFFAVAAVMVFLILFITLRRVVAQMPLFSGGPHTLVAFCVAVLAMLGMTQGAGGALLLPYGAMGIAIILVLMLGVGQAWRTSSRSSENGGRDSSESNQLHDRESR